VQRINFKIVSFVSQLTKSETFKVAMQLKKDALRLAHPWHVLKMSAIRNHTRAKTLTPLFDCVVNHALVRACPFLNDAFSQLVREVTVSQLCGYFRPDCVRNYRLQYRLRLYDRDEHRTTFIQDFINK